MTHPLTDRLRHVRVVLVNPSHGGNIGAAARAMKNMHLSQLALVSPEAGQFPSGEATARAAGADDVLADARVVSTLEEAIAGCTLVIGTSARSRKLPWPMLTPEAAASRLMAAAPGPVALVFGRERTGLTNEELDRCQQLVTIDTNPDFPSLNLGSAVQIMAYELLGAALEQPSLTDVTPRTVPQDDNDEPLNEPLATSADRERYYEHLETVLKDIGFLNPAHPRKLMRRLVRLYNRVDLTQNEINILRGILTAVETRPHKS